MNQNDDRVHLPTLRLVDGRVEVDYPPIRDVQGLRLLEVSIETLGLPAHVFSVDPAAANRLAALAQQEAAERRLESMYPNRYTLRLKGEPTWPEDVWPEDVFKPWQEHLINTRYVDTLSGIERRRLYEGEWHNETE